MPLPTPAASAPSSLSPFSPLPSDSQRAELSVAQRDWRKIRRTLAVAAFSGWTLALFAALTLLFSFSSITGLTLGIALSISAYVEISAARRFGKLRPAAAQTLALNQLALGTAIILYAAWSAHTDLSGSSDLLKAAGAAGGPDAVDLLRTNPDLLRSIILLLYGSLAITSFLAQGGMAWYYLTRRRLLERYLAQTPPWIIQLQHEGFRL